MIDKNGRALLGGVGRRTAAPGLLEFSLVEESGWQPLDDGGGAQKQQVVLARVGGQVQGPMALSSLSVWGGVDPPPGPTVGVLALCRYR